MDVYCCNLKISNNHCVLAPWSQFTAALVYLCNLNSSNNHCLNALRKFSPLVKLCRNSPLGEYCCIQDEFSFGQTVQKFSPVVKLCRNSPLWTNLAENLPLSNIVENSPLDESCRKYSLVSDHYGEFFNN